MIHKVIGKSSKLFFLRYIDIKLFIIQPVISIDADIALFVGVNDKGIRRIFVPVCFQDFRTAVADTGSPQPERSGTVGSTTIVSAEASHPTIRLPIFVLLPWTKP